MQFLAPHCHWCSLQADCGIVQFLAPLCQWCSKWSLIQAECWKVQFLAPLCKWWSKWSSLQADCGKVQFDIGAPMVPCTGWLVKSAFFGPTSSLVLQMVPQYRLTGERYNFFGPTLLLVLKVVPSTGWLMKSQFLAPLCHWYSKWFSCTCWLWKSAIFGPTLSLVLWMVPLYRLTGEKCNFWPPFNPWCSKSFPCKLYKFGS